MDEFTELKALCEKYPDVEITRGDSLNAGNCEDGTDYFLADNFPGRDGVTVKELLPYLETYGVQNVLRYKLLPLEEAKKE